MTPLYPKNFARFYDLIYHQQRDGVDNTFFQDEIKKAKGKVLELGVGTGRLFINALNQGSDIYGLDLSSPMMDVLSQKLDRVHIDRISLQNIINFKFDFKFDLIIAPFRVMMHLLDKEQQLMAINNVFNHLNKNGRFIFDVFVPDLNYLINGIRDYVDFDGEYEKGKNLKRTINAKSDLINQIIEVKFNIEWDENSELKHDEWVMPMRFFFRYELEHLIERTKFNSYKIFGDYLRNPLNSNSKDFIVECIK